VFLAGNNPLCGNSVPLCLFRGQLMRCKNGQAHIRSTTWNARALVSDAGRASPAGAPEPWSQPARTRGAGLRPASKYRRHGSDQTHHFNVGADCRGFDCNRDGCFLAAMIRCSDGSTAARIAFAESVPTSCAMEAGWCGDGARTESLARFDRNRFGASDVPRGNRALRRTASRLLMRACSTRMRSGDAPGGGKLSKNHRNMQKAFRNVSVPVSPRIHC
jgi:hypothetical protein